MFLCTYEELFKRKMSQKEGRQSSDLVEITSDDIEKVTKSDEADKVESDDIGKVTKSHKTDKVELDDIEKVTKSDEADKVESDDIGKVTKSHKTDKVELDDIEKVTKSNETNKVQSDDIGKVTKSHKTDKVELDDIGKVTKSHETDKVESDDIGKVTKSHKTDKVELDDIEKVTKSNETNKVQSDDIGKVTKSHKTDKVELDDIGKVTKSHETDKVESDDIEKVTKSNETNKVQSDGKKDAKKSKSMKVAIGAPKPFSIEWTFIDQRKVDETAWKNLQDGTKKLKAGYGTFFKNILQKDLGVSCKLKPGGFQPAKGLYGIRFSCRITSCKRQYKASQIEDNYFKFFHNNAQIDHKQDEIVEDSENDFQVLNEFDFNQKLNKFIDAPSTVESENINNKNLHFKVDNDVVRELLKKKVEGDQRCDKFVRRFCFDPFILFAFTNDQLKMVKVLSKRLSVLTVNFIVSKSLVLNSNEYMYYYAGVISTGKEIFTLMELVSDELEEFDVKILLDEYRNEMTKICPGIEWPINNCITEYNFNFIEGVCKGWNMMALMTYINHTFSLVSGHLNASDLNAFGLKTWLQFNIMDICKENSKDICIFYPKLDSSKQKLLGNFFTAMCMCSDFNTLGTMWKNLSTILLSKFTNDKVDSALEYLTSINIENSGYEEIDYEYQKLPDDIRTFATIYQDSNFYHHFQAFTHRKTLCLSVGSINELYCEEYSDLFLKKYLSIVPLWTGLTFSQVGSHAIGIEHLKSTGEQLKEPRSIDEFMDRIEAIRRETITAALLVVDQTKKKRKERDQDLRKSTFKNKLFKAPALYFAPKVNFNVSSFGQFLLCNLDYSRLQGNFSLTISLVEFVLVIVLSGTNKIQIEVRKGSSIVENDYGGRGMLKINKQIFMAVLLNDEHFKLLIVNCKKRSFSLVDPMNRDPPEATMMFENFKKFIKHHNKEYCRNKIPEENWELNNLNHQIETDEKKTGLLVLNFVSQYLNTDRIDHVFGPDEYRLELQVVILENSDNMTSKCIVCGSKITAKKKLIISTECKSCNRLTHVECNKETAEHSICVICREIEDCGEFGISDTEEYVEC